MAHDGDGNMRRSSGDCGGIDRGAVWENYRGVVGMSKNAEAGVEWWNPLPRSMQLNIQHRLPLTVHTLGSPACIGQTQ